MAATRSVQITKKAAAKGECANCMKPSMEAMNVCGNCKVTQYCDRDCQAQAWRTGHKKFCVKPEDRKLSRQAPLEAGGVNCVICLSPEAGSFDAHWTGCHVKMHTACLVQLHVSGAAEIPNCPNCRAPLPSMQAVVSRLIDLNEYEKADTLVALLPAELFDTCLTAFHIKYMWATNLEDAGRFDAAEVKYKELIVINKTDANLHEHLAALYLKKNDWKKARIHATLAIRMGSARAEPLHYVGCAQIKEFNEVHGDTLDWKPEMFNPNYQELIVARETFCRVIEKAPRFAPGYYSRAFISFMMGDWEAAVADARQGISLREHPQCRFTLGRALKAMHRFEEAIVEILKGIELDHGSVTGIYHMAQVYYDWGDDDVRNGRRSTEHYACADQHMREVNRILGNE